MDSRLREALDIVNEQAGDPGLWFIADTAPEGYLQQELRRLHEAVEGKSQTQCALDALDSPEATDE